MNSVIGKLSELRYRIMTDKVMEPFGENMQDAAIWNTELKRLDQVSEILNNKFNYFNSGE